MHPDALAIVQKRGLASLMNTTRWRELADALDAIGHSGPMVTLKYINAEAREGPSHIDWQEFLRQGAEWCEWADIHATVEVHRGQRIAPAVIDHTTEILAALRTTRVPFSITAHGFRVWGHVDPGQQPEYA